MKRRIEYYQVASDKMKIILDLESKLNNSTIDKKLIELIKIRVSQINGCSYCIGLHTKDARKNGVNEDEIYLLSVWKETNIYDDKTKIALELTENITQIERFGVSDLVYEKVRTVFNEIEYVDLVLIINQINMWNRLSIAMGNQYIRD
ncbi:carboxymuconolactone decarboxylase family protein [Haploplasma axanthum]|uniref:Argininosuccinate synthase n=1 Tax=Haploplasma axanthum TaxID=29552 RepID=A0A449BE56_HAPAX|nr:carboxymuconolactone decarboxylase family protein [Haploplasma axanthum]VEU80590.1 Argininosuccinate synthase [Haploplasma axanthum]